MDTAAYLRRIGLSERPSAPTAEALTLLQKSHLYTVPYENMDILEGIPLSLRVEDLYGKVVTRHRGGYCFELNELFGWLLRQLGYTVTDYFARFLRGEPEIPMRRHHVLKVEGGELDGAYVADVGVGTGSPTFPPRLTLGEEQVLDGIRYRFTRDELLGWVLEEFYHGGWAPVYSFTEEPQLPVDFVAASFYCEKSPDSIFNKEPMISLRCQGGRRTLDGDEFRRFQDGEVTVNKAEDSDQWQEQLAEWFGLRL